LFAENVDTVRRGPPTTGPKRTTRKTTYFRTMPFFDIHNSLGRVAKCLKRGGIFIPAKAFARDYGITGVRLSVCLSVATITK